MADLNEYEFFEGVDLREDVRTLMQIFGDSWEECRAEDCRKCKYRHGKEQYALLACISERYAENLIDAGVAPVRHGRWLLEANKERVNFRWNVTAECSNCCDEKKEIWGGFFPNVPDWLARDTALINAKSVKLSNHCPNCGARMDGGESNA